MWLTGLVAPWHVGSSQTRARTRVPCIGRRILNHCATREALLSFLSNLLITVSIPSTDSSKSFCWICLKNVAVGPILVFYCCRGWLNPVYWCQYKFTSPPMLCVRSVLLLSKDNFLPNFLYWLITLILNFLPMNQFTNLFICLIAYLLLYLFSHLFSHLFKSVY